MTTQDIDKLEAGRELDALVAQAVFNEEVRQKRAVHDIDNLYISGELPLPQYSTDISAAWQVVEKIKHTLFIIRQDDAWFIGSSDKLYHDNMNIISEAPTAPLAICRAALKAVSQ